ncbi:hypothetical protein D6C86_07954 [Aureobasidium pullulans]|uniref:Thioredoxin-like protein n=1 Tax=Aureobasidium pullulans TaxID=5580 RepID=A0A4S9WAW8_AURPU|nr:hypothetical protein JADG_008058 [Aureobasidium pullulans]THW11063.1 hypothetical protein D6D25_07525 [Aureobasidium pullulans]THW15490.1 hypothetical protein D6D24_04924 [Aureobasidium pullulans]THW64457.1 hypothetical protein D6D20_02852 [Aureobasidium pullulans]THX57957.1 hypothetical protein D6D08_09140 [Aureobasidium pullulans]
MPDLNTKSDAESHNNDQAQTRLPTQTELEKVAEVDILDKNGDKKKFSSLWSSHSDKPRRRTIVIFIRHFNCESCADYVRALTAKLSPEDLASRSIPTELFIVGCGSHTFIQTYIQRTGCKFEIYTDPSRVTYDTLGMTCNLGLGKKPNYITNSLMGTLIGTGNTLMTLLTDSGKKSQNGGELIWVDGEIKWARRMQNTRDHVEVEELERVLDEQE